MPWNNMTDKRKILYIEDMPECYKKTEEALGNDFDIDWRKDGFSAIKAITSNLKDYSAAIFDVNLNYNPNKPENEQSTEGLYLIRILKERCNRWGIKIPIICASSNGTAYEQFAIEAGADRFLWKKELWEGKGKEVLEELVKKV